MTKTYRLWAMLGLVGVLVLLAPRTTHGADEEHVLVPAIREAIVAHSYDKADALLRAIPVEHPSLTLLRGLLDVYRQDCVRAKATFQRPELQLREDVPALRELAEGCARVTALATVVRDEAAGVELRFQDENDVALAPQIVETVVAARTALARDLGVELARPAHLTIVRDHLSLSAATGLPYSAAKTTGVVGIAKWGRVTLLSPRATPSGYGWIDTLAHELTHMVITQATLDQAPLWLQEGLARTEEVRWRAPSPYDDHPPVIETLGRQSLFSRVRSRRGLPTRRSAASFRCSCVALAPRACKPCSPTSVGDNLWMLR
jgi:hypothetical protein